MAPEVVIGLDGTIKADMWALGIIMFQLITKKFPFKWDGKNENQLRESIRDPNSEPDQLPETVNPLLRTVIYELLDKNPESRPDADMLLAKLEIQQEVEYFLNKIRQVDPMIADLILQKLSLSK